MHGWPERSAVLPEVLVHDLPVPTLTPLTVQHERVSLARKRAHFISQQVPYLRVMSVQRHWCRGKPPYAPRLCSFLFQVAQIEVWFWCSQPVFNYHVMYVPSDNDLDVFQRSEE